MAENFIELEQMDLEVLRILNGEDIPGWVWGAAMSVCAEYLKSIGYAQGLYEISNKGKEYLRRNGF